MGFIINENDLGEASMIIQKLRDDNQIEVSERTVSRFGYVGQKLLKIMGTFEYVFNFENIKYEIQMHQSTGQVRYMMK